MTASILESALRSLMMAAVVWAGIKMLRVSSVLVQKMAWSLVLFSALAMPALMHWHALQPKSAVIVPIHHLLPETVNAPASTTITAFPEIAPAAAVVRQAATPGSYSPIAHWREWIMPAYFLVSAILLLRLLVGLALALRIWHRAEPASVLLDPRANEVRISDDIQTPVTIGSSIILPAWHSDWDQRKLHMVLAHERSHVHQGDFYLQFVAGVYAALFWFSPLGWWLKKEISDLGEAISDRAALKEAQSRATYAEVLVEFAAMPRRPLAGVAMARSSNIRRRVDRLLVDQKFRGAFTTHKWHLAATATLVPVALVAAIALVRVQTAEAMKLSPVTTPQLTEVKPAASVAPAPALIRLPIVAQIPALQEIAVAPRAVEPAPAAEMQATAPHTSSHIHVSNDDENSYAIVSGDSSNFTGSDDSGGEFERVRSRMHGNYIWFERDGKSYVIDDPALVQQSQQLFKPMEELGRRQAELGEQQGRLGAEQGRLGELQASATAPAPDLSKEVAHLQEELKKLEENKQMQMTQSDLSNIQSRVGELQGKIGDVQAKIGEKQAELGDQQARLGEQQAKLGSQQAELGAKQAKLSEEASRSMKSLIDSAMQNGKAHPVD